MEIWLIKASETLPIDDGDVLGRVGSLAQYFSDNGNNMVWWTSTFRHASKTYRFDQYTEVDVSDCYKLCLLHSRITYNKNMSFRRLRYYRVLARQMKRKMRMMEKPDLIYCSWPAEQLCRVAIDYGNANHIPVIVDARDQWPDIFVRAFPNRLRGIANLFLRPMKKKAAYVFRNANALCAVSPVFLEWALGYAGRDCTDLDQYIYIGNAQSEFSKHDWEKAIQKWKEKGISKDTWNICLFSTLSKASLDMDTVIDAVRLVHDSYPYVRLIIGGKGDDEERLLEYISDLDYVLMMGWMNQIQMSSLMSIAKIGILNYRDTKEFKNIFGNKVGQYLSYGLPILTSTNGIAKMYLEQYTCGIHYEENNAQNLADTILHLIKHPDEREAMTMCAYERFSVDFDQRVILKQFEKMFDDVYKQFYSDGDKK